MVDVLSFVHVHLPWLAGGDGASSRQLAVNGKRLDEFAGGPTSTLLVAGVEPQTQVSYLKELLGEENAGPRLHLGYCDQCLDNDGWLLATTLTMSERRVQWSRVGFDHENGFPVTKEGPWWRRTVVEAPADWKWWVEQERDEELSFTFHRSHYEATVRAELDRVEGAE